MGRQRGQTSVDIRKLIIDHYQHGYNVRVIAGMVNRSHSTVHDVIKRFKDFGRIKNKVRQSPRKIFSDYEERWIVRKIKENPKLSAPKIRLEVKNFLKKDVSVETIRNVLRKYNYNGRIARKKPFISVQNKKKRLEFAKVNQNKNIDYWNSVLFTDESKFNLFGSDGKGYVWRKANTELRLENLSATIKHGGGSVMVWGCMSAAGTGELAFIEGNMDQNMYLDILKNNLKKSAEKLGIIENFSFYQDNDPKHKALKVRNWLLYNCPHVIETPAQSPDLNVIENLWSYLESKLRNHKISNKNDLKEALLLEWERIEPSYCASLVKSMPKRLASVLKSKGLHTKY